MYIIGAQAHPLNSSWLLALLPYLPLLNWQRRDLVHEGTTKLGSMGIACSRDGVHWSAPTPLLECIARFKSEPIVSSAASRRPVHAQNASAAQPQMNESDAHHGSWRLTVLPVHNGVQVLPDGSAFVWVQEDVAGVGMSRDSCLGPHPKTASSSSSSSSSSSTSSCQTVVRRYRLNDVSVLRTCMRDA